MATIRNIIRTQVKTALRTIITDNNSGNGYLYVNTLRNNNLYSRPVSVEKMAEFPAINIDLGEEVCANSEVNKALQTGGNRQLLHNSVDLMLDCFLKDEDQTTAQDNILADIQALFGNNYSINGSVFNCVYKSSMPFGLQGNGPNCGILIYFRIWYRIYSTNPNTSG